MNRCFFPLAIVAMCTSVAQAQEFEPLSDMVERGVESTYPMVRCAAFYRSVYDWYGEENLNELTDGKAVYYKSLEIGLLMFAASVRAKHSSKAMVLEMTGAAENAGHIGKLYRQRFQENYAREGQPIGSDPLILSDMEACKPLAAHTQQNWSELQAELEGN